MKKVLLPALRGILKAAIPGVTQLIEQKRIATGEPVKHSQWSVLAGLVTAIAMGYAFFNGWLTPEQFKALLNTIIGEIFGQV